MHICKKNVNRAVIDWMRRTVVWGRKDEQMANEKRKEGWIHA